MSLDQMKVAALGRPFALGLPYDARKDELHIASVSCNKRLFCCLYSGQLCVAHYVPTDLSCLRS
ncbi:hypothetical protein Q5P01_023103 [Channa striata]|uniref:Uncharacterized protein n=1 Tax=Channa striata TaxID=64152 RepID=A0AA88LJZ4_CHASR|nr:hypothetical protein Q5P01_023103 [Channa striata]